MTRQKINHRKRARKVWPRLVQIAQSRGFITYAEIAAFIGLHHRSARWFLGVIQRECRRRGLPPLQALVVNKQTRRPGSGYVASPVQGKGYRKTVRQVRAFDWPSTAPF